MPTKERSEHKPLMSKARRKVLDLLECLLELDPKLPSVASLFYVLARENEDIAPWSDEAMAVILENRVNDIMNREADNVASKSV